MEQEKKRAVALMRYSAIAPLSYDDVLCQHIVSVFLVGQIVIGDGIRLGRIITAGRIMRAVKLFHLYSGVLSGVKRGKAFLPAELLIRQIRTMCCPVVGVQDLPVPTALLNRRSAVASMAAVDILVPGYIQKFKVVKTEGKDKP